ncbi:hypothetical protein DU976_17245 [Vibrio navarrensis]|nr:hypothetical protein [Vibrio navarrensis]
MNGLGWLAVGVVAVVMLRRKMAASLNEWAADNTQSAGQALSDLFARLNGWEPVELAPLMIRDFYLDKDNRLTPDADFTLWKVPQYQPLLNELFGKRGGQLKPQYHALINVEITKKNVRGKQ